VAGPIDSVESAASAAPAPASSAAARLALAGSLILLGPLLAPAPGIGITLKVALPVILHTACRLPGGLNGRPG
jgi:hypothetical protein